MVGWEGVRFGAIVGGLRVAGLDCGMAKELAGWEGWVGVYRVRRMVRCMVNGPGGTKGQDSVALRVCLSFFAPFFGVF